MRMKYQTKSVLSTSFTFATAPGKAVSRLAKPPVQDPAVDQQIDCDRQSAENILGKRRESRRVNDRNEILNNKISRVGSFTGQPPQMILQRGQRTNPSGKFDERSPAGGGQMKPGHSRPEKHQQAARRDKKDE